MAAITPLLRDFMEFSPDLVFGVPLDVSPGEPFLSSFGVAPEQTRRRIRAQPQKQQQQQQQRQREEHAWRPAVDVFEEGNSLFVEVELPGMEKKNVDVRFVGNALEIYGTKELKLESEKEEKIWYKKEIKIGDFKRVIPLPKGVEPGKITAKFSDGILEIRVPKPEEREEKEFLIEISKKAKKENKEKGKKEEKKKEKEKEEQREEKKKEKEREEKKKEKEREEKREKEKEEKKKEKKKEKAREQKAPKGELHIQEEVVEKIGKKGEKKEASEQERLQGEAGVRQVIE